MTIRLGVVMDAMISIHQKKDSTLPVLIEAQKRGFELYYFEQQDLFLRDGIAHGFNKRLYVHDNADHWFDFGETSTMPLADLSIIFMRKDPPFDENYLYTTYILEQAENEGVVVFNRPRALRDANEKMFTSYFSAFCPPTLVTMSIASLRDFWKEQGDIVCKPLNSMGGTSVFHLGKDEPNANVIFTTLTNGGKTFIMAQRFIPEIATGDKRILFINGEVVPHVLVRIPQSGDWRGNLAVGAKGIVQPLSVRDQQIVATLGPVLRERGLYFVGIDIIGDYLTEVNVTSPTGIREITAATGINISAKIVDAMEALL